MSDSNKPEAGQKDRRGVVKGLAVGVGGVTITQWAKPVVESVVIPAHAQTTTGRVVLNAALQGGIRTR